MGVGAGVLLHTAGGAAVRRVVQAADGGGCCSVADEMGRSRADYLAMPDRPGTTEHVRYSSAPRVARWWKAGALETAHQ
jgi:hypothetical protein